MSHHIAVATQLRFLSPVGAQINNHKHSHTHTHTHTHTHACTRTRGPRFTFGMVRINAERTFEGGIYNILMNVCNYFSTLYVLLNYFTATGYSLHM